MLSNTSAANLLCATNFTGNMSEATAYNGCIFATTATPVRRNSTESLIITILTIFFNAVGMVGIGCTVDHKILWSYIKRPKAYLIGVGLQLFMVPLIAWGLAKAFQMEEPERLGVLIQGCTPGGSTSNLVVYWMGGVVDLSVTMTATSTLLALGTMPLWLFIFSEAENFTDSLAIPFQDLGIVVVSLAVPLAIGIFIHYKFPQQARIITRVFVLTASLAILALLIYQSVTRGSTWRFSWQQAVCGVIMPVVIFVIAYIVTMTPCVGLNHKLRTTVAVETALQNVQIATTVITLSFANQPLIRGRMVAFPLLYYILQLSYSVIFITIMRIGQRRGWCKQLESPDNEVQATDEEKGVDNPGIEEESESTKI